MADTVTARSALLTAAADNTTGAITPQILRNVIVSTLGITAVATTATNYTIGLDDGAVFGNASSGSITVTLPTASTVTGRVFMVSKSDSSANTVTIVGTVSGITNPVLSAQYSFQALMCDGTSYYNISDTQIFHKAVSAEITALTQKTAPVAADTLLAEDSASGNSKAGIRVGNIFKGDISIPINKTSALGRLHTWGTDTSGGINGVQANDIVADGVVGADKGISIRDNGVAQWEEYIYRSEGGEFLYWWNDPSQIDAMVLSRSGRLALNRPDNLTDSYTYFTGTGSNDLTVDASSIYTDDVTGIFQIKILGNGSPDTFQYRKSYDNGVTWNPGYTGSVNCSTSATLVADGVYVKFTSATGHTIGDVWQFTAFTQVPSGTLTVNPRRLFVHNYNGSTYTDYTYVLNSKQSASTFWPALMHQGANDGYLYVGANSQINSVWVTLYTAAVGMTLKSEYYNGSWTTLTLAAHNFLDGTAAFTVDGGIRWDKAYMADWATTTINGVAAYWIRLSSTSTLTTAPVVKYTVPHGQYRFAAFSGFYDTVPSFFIDAKGRASFDTGVAINQFSTDITMGGGSPSDSIVPTQSAVASFLSVTLTGIAIANANKQYML